MAKTTVEIKLPSRYDSEDAEIIAEEILNFIVERTKKGVGSDGKKFPEYSSEYINSFDFKAAGKSKGKVDLTLSGEMLDSIEIIEAKKGKIVYGYSSDNEMQGRAEGNLLGTYGRDAPNPSKARNFLALSGKELSLILSEVDLLPSDIQKEISKAAKDGAIRILDSVSMELDEAE